MVWEYQQLLKQLTWINILITMLALDILEWTEKNVVSYGKF